MTYSSWNNTYGLMTNEGPRQSLIFPRLRKLIGGAENAQILDLGCGNGATLYNLLDTNFKAAVGVDVNPDLLDYGTKHVTDQRITFQQGDITLPLQLGNHTFDIVLGIHILNDLRSAEPFFKQGSRHLKPDGTMATVCLHPMVPVFWQVAEQAMNVEPKISDFGSYFETGHETGYKLSGSGDRIAYYHKSFGELYAATTNNNLVITKLEELGLEQTESVLRRPVDIPKFLYMELRHS